MPVPHSYENLTLQNSGPGDAFTDSNPQISNVETKFDSISSQASHVAVTDGDLFPLLRYTRVNQAGINWGLNHLQGVQRLRRTNFLVISAGDKVIEASHLFVVQLASRRKTRYWGSNVLTQTDPPEEDAVVDVFALDMEAWHAGGISVMGDVLAIPIYAEHPVNTKILFLNMREPRQPTVIPITLDRNQYNRSNAVAMARMPNGRYLCAVWREVGTRPQGRIDFHLSVDTDLRNGFHADARTWSFADVRGIGGGNRTYQNINFIMPSDIPQDTSSDGGTVFYMVGTENESSASPAEPGADIADLFRVEFPNSLFDNADSTDSIILTRLSTRKFHAGNEYANFDAAAGIYTSTNDTLGFYAGYHWRHHDVFRFSEFPPLGTEEQPGGTWVELFEDSDFQGRRLTLRNQVEATIRNFGEIQVQAKGFDDKVSSLRFLAPPGTTLVLYEHKNFDPGGRRVELQGTGSVMKIPNLDAHGFNMGDDGSSMRFV